MVSTAETTPAVDETVKPDPRIYYFDHLRVYAMVGVVLLHASAPIVIEAQRHDHDLVSHATFANLANGAGRFGVDSFFMVSGALLLSSSHRFRLGKQVLRVLIPLLVWSLLYIAVLAFLWDHGLPRFASSNRDPGSVSAGLRSILYGPVAGHLWFVYVLLGIYLVVPLLRPLTRLPYEARAKLLRYALVLWLVFTVAPQTYHAVRSGARHLYEPALPSVPVQFVGVFLLGFYLHHHSPTFRGRPLPRWSLVTGALIGYGMAVLLTEYSRQLDISVTWTVDDLSPQVIVFAASTVLLAKATLNRPTRGWPFIALASGLTFRIYLMHFLVLFYLYELSPLHHWYRAYPMASIPTMTVLTLVICFGLAWLIDKAGPVRHYV
jgi:surface polysaccharide O-acyltransferase-like enzyme